MSKRMLLIAVVVMCFCFSGCVKPEANTKNIKEKISESDFIEVYIDPETGVNYLLYAEYREGGITPRYTADGRLYVTSK